jgi:glycosyltransferase involved in cell wall biosynthesis
MAEAIVAAIRDPDLVQGMADDGRRHIRQAYDWAPLAGKLVESWDAAQIEIATTPVEELM